MNNYTQVFITNLPSFYKINLYNEINKRQKIFVIFTETTERSRNQDFYKGNINFEYINLGNKSQLKKAFTIIKLIKTLRYKMIVIGGWDSIANWIIAFTSPKKKNALVVESSCIESKTNGLKGLLKRFFLLRINTVFASGTLQRELIQNLGFTRKIIITKGVGIFNIIKQPTFTPKSKVKKFIYVGRFVKCKNLEFLVNAFKKLPNLKLTMIGFGDLETHLRKIAPPNVEFVGAVDNDKLSYYYSQHDVFILPSISEPWGLVIEEALNNGLPVLTSSNVGCNKEVAIEGENAIHFSPYNEQSLIETIKKICNEEIYNQLAKNISTCDFNKVTSKQIQVYII